MDSEQQDSNHLCRRCEGILNQVIDQKGQYWVHNLEDCLAVRYKENATLKVEVKRANNLAELLATEGLIAVAGSGIPTPEKGYGQNPHELKHGIREIRQQRDMARDALVEFCDLVENGNIRSKRTYLRFKTIMKYIDTGDKRPHVMKEHDFQGDGIREFCIFCGMDKIEYLKTDFTVFAEKFNLVNQAQDEMIDQWDDKENPSKLNKVDMDELVD